MEEKEDYSYGKLQDLYSYVYLNSGKLFATECKSAEHVLSISFSAYTDVAKHATLDEKHQYLLAFFYRNCIYLSATYNLIRQGMLDPAGNNMRTIFETIIWQYAYLCDEAIYTNFKQITEIESEKLKLIRQRKWSNTKERNLENMRRKYNFQKMMKSIYSKELYEKFFFSQYWMMCQKSHTSIFGINYNTPNMHGTTTLENNPKELRGNLHALLYLYVENLTCFLNCFYNTISQDKIDLLLRDINTINKQFPVSLSLVPDTKKLEFNSQFKPL
jgi:hypothetical protein